MKRQTLMQLVVSGLILLAFLGFVLILRFKTDRLLDPARQQSAALGSFTLRVPEALGSPRIFQDRAWQVTEYRDPNLGVLRLATEPADGTPWETLCVQWFGVPGYQAGPVRFRAWNDGWLFREVPLFGRGAVVVRERGKELRYIAFFENQGTRHWLQLDSRNALAPGRKVFDAMVLSLRDGSGTAPAAGLRETLLGTGQDRFIPPPEAIFLVPLAAIVVISLIQAFIRRWAARLPGERPLFAPFAEGGLEMGFIRPFQRKFVDCAVVVEGEDLTVYTFGKPFLRVPRAHCRGRIEEGKAWLGHPFLQIDLPEPPVFLKWASAYRRLRLPLKLRIYTPDPDRLRAALS